MDAKRVPLMEDEPKYKKKSKKKGQPRANHKHEYKTVLLHSYYDNPFKREKMEHLSAQKVCITCGRIGDVDETRYVRVKLQHPTCKLYELQIKDQDTLEDWYCDGIFDKFAVRKECDTQNLLKRV